MAAFAFETEPAAAREGMAGWPEIDVSVLDEKRGPVPPLPLDLLADPWQEWVRDTASATGAPNDYVVQAVLAGLAAVCGAGIVVRITPAWSEPLVFWQAAVGGPSSGKSRALAPMRRLLGSIEEERQAGDDDRREHHAKWEKSAGTSAAFVPSQVIIGDGALETVADVCKGNPRGVILWRDDPTWLGQLGPDHSDWRQAWAAGAVTIKREPAESPLHLQHFPVSILGTIQPDALNQTLQQGDDNLAARFLYAWPGAQPYCPLADRKTARDDDALKMLRRVHRLARTPDDPLVLSFDERGVEAFDEFLAGLHADRDRTEGLEAAWLGKGPATVARLAGALELLAWSGSGAPGLPGQIGRDQVEAAGALWTTYCMPHARAVFDRAAPSDFARRVRRVARWLKDTGKTEVSREEVRRGPLNQSVTAHDTDQVFYRLHFLGFVRPTRCEPRKGAGRPTNRWQVNPALGQM
jgi:hypothetical protein